MVDESGATDWGSFAADIATCELAGGVDVFGDSK